MIDDLKIWKLLELTFSFHYKDFRLHEYNIQARHTVI